MLLPPLNYLAVLASGVLIFMLGGLWYSPVLFAKRWMALTGKREEELRAGSGSMPLNYIAVFLCGLLSAWIIAVVLGWSGSKTAMDGALVGALCWVGFAGATSYGTSIFSGKPRELWLIDSGFNLVSFILAGIVLSLWR